MPGVHWSTRAKAKLGSIDPAVRDQLMGNAPEILHHVPPAKFPRDEGFADEIMWHRAIPCGTQLEGSGVEEDDDGPWDYVFFYSARHSCPEHWVVCFEILDIRGSTDIAPKIADIS